MVVMTIIKVYIPNLGTITGNSISGYIGTCRSPKFNMFRLKCI